MKYLSKIVFVLAFGFLLMGCQNNPPAPINPNWPIRVDKTLQDKITVVNVASRNRADKLSQVQFILKNRLPHTSVDALYQVQWFDADGFKIKSITDTFMKIHLGPDAEKTFDAISTSPKAKIYKIIIVDYEKNKKRIPNDNLQNNN